MARSSLEVNVNVFIYLFIWLPSCSKLPLAVARGFYCHVLVFLFWFFFSPLDLGTFWGGLRCLLGRRGSGTAAVVPSVGAPCLLPGVGLGCLGRGIADCT